MTLSLPDGAVELTCLHIDASLPVLSLLPLDLSTSLAGSMSVPTILASAEAYNVEEDKWEILPPMIQPHDWGCRSIFIEEKFMVLGRGKFDRSEELFDPSVGTWRLEDMLSFDGDLWTCVASSSGELYALCEE
jgi:hypothetical protein